MTPLTRKYEEVKVPLSPASRSHTYLMSCIDCSTFVSDIPKHDNWHALQDLTMQYVKYLRGDGPFPEDIAPRTENGQTTLDAPKDLPLA